MTDLTKRIEEMRQVPALRDVPENELQWLAPKLIELSFPAGAFVTKDGEPADSFHILLEGEFELRPGDSPSSGRSWVSRAGDITGKLPYSRLTVWPGSFRAVIPARVL